MDGNESDKRVGDADENPDGYSDADPVDAFSEEERMLMEEDPEADMEDDQEADQEEGEGAQREGLVTNLGELVVRVVAEKAVAEPGYDGKDYGAARCLFQLGLLDQGIGQGVPDGRYRIRILQEIE